MRVYKHRTLTSAANRDVRRARRCEYQGHGHRAAVVFLFVDEDPSAVAIYPDLDWARGSLESLDVASFRNQAFLATGQVVELADSGDCSQLSLSPIGFELDLLKGHLKFANGPKHLPDDPAAYPREWLRLTDSMPRGHPSYPRPCGTGSSRSSRTSAVVAHGEIRAAEPTCSVRCRRPLLGASTTREARTFCRRSSGKPR